MSDNTMTYRGYTAVVEYSAEDGCLVGRLVGITDLVGFHGSSIREVKRNLRLAVNHYIRSCEAVGKSPQQSSPVEAASRS